MSTCKIKSAVFLVVLYVIGAVPSGSWAQLYYDEPEFAWIDNRDPEAPRTSPNALVGLQIGSTRVMIAYGAPSVRGRDIFGGIIWVEFTERVSFTFEDADTQAFTANAVFRWENTRVSFEVEEP